MSAIYTKAQLRAACAPLALTMNRAEIAKHFGLNLNRVVQAMIGLPRKPHTAGVPRADRAEILPQALKMRATMSMVQIAARFQVAPMTVQNWFAGINDARQGVDAAPKWAKAYVAAERGQDAEEGATHHAAPQRGLPGRYSGW